MEKQIVLIIGTQRGGTTILAALLGAHSKINAICEGLSPAALKLCGKPITVNKLLTHQIGFKTRQSFLGHLLNRAVNFGRKPRLYIAPISFRSLHDYKKAGAKIIVITRDKKSCINSMVTRSGYNKILANYMYNSGIKKINKIDGAYKITLQQLTMNTINTLCGICDWLGIQYEDQMLSGYKYMSEYTYNKIEKRI